MSINNRKAYHWLSWFGWLLLTACANEEPADSATATQAAAADSSSAVAQVNAIADQLLEHLREHDAYVRMQSGLPVTELNGISLEDAQREARINKDRLARLDAIPIESLPHEQQVLASILRHYSASRAQAEQGYWLEFAVTPHAGNWNLVGVVHEILATRELRTTADLDNYLHLLEEYRALLDQAVAKTQAQAERGMRVPKPAIPGVLTQFQELSTSAAATFSVTPERLESFPAQRRTAFAAAVASMSRSASCPDTRESSQSSTIPIEAKRPMESGSASIRAARATIFISSRLQRDWI